MEISNPGALPSISNGQKIKSPIWYHSREPPTVIDVKISDLESNFLFPITYHPNLVMWGMSFFNQI